MESSKAKILIADDHKSLVRTLERLLSKAGYELNTAEDGEAALHKISEWMPELILLDLNMPKMDGLEVCRRLKTNHRYRHIYILMLTAKGEAEDEVTGFDLGADDYVIKPFNPATLLARIRRGLKVAEEKREAMFDSLTGLYNRRIFDEFLSQEIAKFRRYQHPLSLILIDLDHFKNVNDVFGHKTGDTVLQGIAEILQEGIRRADLPARWGGEELAVLLPETAQKDAEKVAEKLRQKIEKHNFPEAGRVTASFGVSGLTNPVYDIVKAADTALYHAKQAGRNKVVGASCANPAPLHPKNRVS